MKVLHDYDRSKYSWRWMLYYSVKLFIYAVFTLFRLRPPRICSDITHIRYRYALTLAKLDRLCGIEPVFGVRDCVVEDYPGLVPRLHSLDADVHRHIHIGGNDDPNRRRLWNPPIPNTEKTWHYGLDYKRGTLPLLDKGELPIWHCDWPHRWMDYIDYLYDVRFNGLQVYKKGGE